MEPELAGYCNNIAKVSSFIEFIPFTTFRTIGSAQVKSAILLSALNTPGITTVEEKIISRNHTENLLSSIDADIKIKKLNQNVSSVIARSK